MNKQIYKSFFIALTAIFLFNGCISLTKELPAQKTYSLTLEDKQINTNNKFYDKTIRIYEPKALSSMNTKAILYSRNSIEQEEYALSKWSDKPSKIIQQIVAKYLTKQNKYKYITVSNIKVPTDYKIMSELVEFKQTFTKNKSYADFSIRVYLINNHTQKVYFKSFTYNKLSDTNNAKGLVYGINNISNNFLFDLQQFLQKSLKKDAM
ncbi:ABC-type transport auxiliary lipoprotein family protein [Arcobacter sp. LA11]|uniref:ABC-type transport auxiliary lipoprotein family protein n=1 Tax=Arcobacter sp. LA11 TaxID=1898176 RepID=UPI000932BA95|nr:ABC-type transport auxiliary lipoprotein family protein [Arcobacter sp. LA11]